VGPAPKRLNPLKSFRKKFPKPDAPETAEAARQRRLSKIVHDERGAASVEWRDAPGDYERPVLEVDDPLASTRNSKVRGGIEVLHIKHDDTFNPYERQPEDRKKEGDGTRRDLRKLSEYIKMMRELEERKKNGSDGEEE
jgi:hypothetical protein